MNLYLLEKFTVIYLMKRLSDVLLELPCAQSGRVPLMDLQFFSVID